MPGFIIFLLISFAFWIYTTKINKKFYPSIEKKLVDYINGFMKKINPLGDNLFNNNIPLMKINLYQIAFNKNLDLFNKIYNSTDYQFINSSTTTRILTFADINGLIPQNIQLTNELIDSKLKTITISNSKFSNFFINLSNKGVYLLDYLDLFKGLFNPILILRSQFKTDEQKLQEINILLNYNYTADNITQLKNNIDLLIDTIFETIIKLSNITINYKQLVDYNYQIISINGNTTAPKDTITARLSETFQELNVYYGPNINLNTTFIKNNLYKVINSNNNFINNQENSIYILLYKMFLNIETFEYYNSQININL